MDPRIIELMGNARKPFELNAKKGDRILIIVDTETDPLVWQAYAAGALSVGAEPTLVMMPVRPYHQAEPTSLVAAAMKEADLCVLLTSKAMLHSTASIETMKAGVKVIASEELSPDMLARGAATADYIAMQDIGRKVQQSWNEGMEVHLTSDLGTDLRANIEGRLSWLAAGIVLPTPGMDLYAAAFPDGEVGVSPVEGTAEGVVVWDTSAHNLGLLNEPVSIVFKKGIAVEINGGVEAKRLRDYLETNGDENCYNLAEIAIGINPQARIVGVMREDKKIMGSVHVALGANHDSGGHTYSKLHVDGIMLNGPSVSIDGKVILEKGVLRL